MFEFIFKNIQFFAIAILAVTVGYYAPVASYLLIPLLFLSFIRNKQELYMFLFLYLLLVLSDNLAFRFASSIKPIVMIIFAGYIASNKRFVNENPIFKTFLVFFVYTILLLPLSPDLFRSAQKNISYILLYFSVPGFIMYLIKKYGELSILGIIRLCALILLIGIGLRIVAPHLVISHEIRFTGLFGNPNGIAIFSFFTFALLKVFKEHLNKDNTLSNTEYWLIVFLIFGSLLLSRSRTSLLAMVLFIFFNQFRSIPKIISFMTVLFMVAAYDFLLNGIISLIMQLGLGQAFRIEGTESIEKASGRIIAWEYAWEEIQNSFYFGRGWIYDEIWIFGPIQEKLNLLNHQGGVHNTFLILWLNTGLVGLVLFLYALLSNFFKAAKKSDLALPILYAVIVLAMFEPWLSSSLNPYTIILLTCLTIMLKSDSLYEVETT